MGQIALAPILTQAGLSAGTAATIGTIASTGFTLLSGLQQYRASRAESQELKDQAEFEALRAQQEEANRQARLSQILSTQVAQAAGRGGSVGSGSFLAITDFSLEEAQREGGIAALDSQFRQDQIRLRAQQARRVGTGALFSALGSAAENAYGYYQSRAERQLTSGQ